MELGLTGDVMFGRNVDECQRSRPPARIWGDLRERLQALDGLFVNLECALSTRGEPWTRTERAFHFRADPGWAVPALEAAGVDLASLANNHLLDFEEAALLDTLDALDDAGIDHAGAGADDRRARAPALVRVGGFDIAVVAFTDNTPEYAAGPATPGVAYLDMDLSDADRRSVRKSLRAARALDPDLLVASVHWGPNMVAEPSRQYRRFGEWLLAAGVDVVWGHSAHVFQGVERRNDGLILHDTGDFVDDYAVNPALRNNRSFLFVLHVTPDSGVTSLDLLPTTIEECAVHRATGETAAWCRETMRERSEVFGTATAYERVGSGLRLSLSDRG